jgi:hypothetical protein
MVNGPQEGPGQWGASKNRGSVAHKRDPLGDHEKEPRGAKKHSQINVYVMGNGMCFLGNGSPRRIEGQWPTRTSRDSQGAKSAFSTYSICNRPIPSDTTRYRPIAPETARYRPIPHDADRCRPIPPDTTRYRPTPPRNRSEDVLGLLYLQYMQYSQYLQYLHDLQDRPVICTRY